MFKQVQIQMHANYNFFLPWKALFKCMVIKEIVKLFVKINYFYAFLF